MISLHYLTKEELRELFEGFNTEFLQQPLRRPTKSLNRFMPKGFRPDKMPRNMIIKMYCDAVSGQEPSITTFVVNEITHQFDRVGIDKIVEDTNPSDAASVSLSIIRISAMTWDDGLVIPAHIAMKLYGIKCGEDHITASTTLFKSHFDAMAQQKQVGKDEATAAAANDIQAEVKKQSRLQKRIDSLEEQNESLVHQLAKAKEEVDEFEDQLSVATSSNERLQEIIEGLNKQIVVLKNDLTAKTSVINEQEQAISDLEVTRQKVIDLENALSGLKISLEHAKAMAFSDDVIRRLSLDVIDELKASSLGAKETLAVAKKRFSEATTIEEAWTCISDYSDGQISPLMMSLSEENYSTGLLDTLDEIEDGILIKYAVIKSLKSVLFHGLEEQEANKTIAEEFATSEG